MRNSASLLLAALLLHAAAPRYRLALPGYRYEFPRDHFNHPDFQTEWWYYTGNLRSSDGRSFGFELTFFRHAVRPDAPAGIWDVRDVWLAHLALSDIDGNRFFHEQRLNRAGPGLAGADLAQARVWSGNWQARWSGHDDAQTLQAVAERFRFDLTLRTEKPPVVHGINGVSRKAAGEGRASHYVSLTRLAVRGSVAVDGREFAVTGLAWMDHEFFTHQLAPDQTGWDWFSMQFDNNTELMLFRIRRKDGSADPYSAGTYVDAQGRARHLSAGDFSLTPGKTWTSAATGGRYPIEWRVRVPSLGIDADVHARLPQQELTGRTAYWEGAVRITGSRSGVGYLEMTGYAGPVYLGG